MLSYEQWDAIADAYIPLLAIVSLACLIRGFYRQGLKSGARTLLRFVALIAVVYILMFLDLALNLWPYFTLDYSTHSALAIVLVCFLFEYQRVQGKIALTVSLLAYAVLMRYQNYHSVADMLTTAAAILPLSYVIMSKSAFKKTDKQTPEAL